MRQSREMIQRALFGGSLLPQEFTIALAEPQSEVAVWLHGLEEPVDVTYRHSMACAEPLILCLPFERGMAPGPQQLSGLALEFRRRDTSELLGRIALKPSGTSISLAGMELILFGPRHSDNYCLPNLRLCVHYLLYIYRRRKRANRASVTMSFLEERAAMVLFIRPHPVFLGSVSWDTGGNIFTMNLLGDLGNGYVAFALKDSRKPAHLVERIRRIAVSSIPFSYGPIAFQLAINHTMESIDLERLPFSTKLSHTFRFPVPVFTARVRELQVEIVHRIGSHTLFAARVISDESYSDAPGLNVIHGFYQSWRIKRCGAGRELSVEQDAINKREATVTP